jgi:hypothetical protein
MGGLLFMVWGYVDRPALPAYLEVAVDLLSLGVPTLFSVGLVGFYARGEGQLGRLGEAGLVLGFNGSVLDALVGLGSVHGLGALGGLAGIAPPWHGHTFLRLCRSLWIPTLLAGLTLAGIATVGQRRSGGLGALPLAMGAFGWAYHFTDLGAIFEARSVHVGFGLLFALGWAGLGFFLLLTGRGAAPEQPSRVR